MAVNDENTFLERKYISTNKIPMNLNFIQDFKELFRIEDRFKLIENELNRNKFTGLK